MNRPRNLVSSPTPTPTPIATDRGDRPRRPTAATDRGDRPRRPTDRRGHEQRDGTALSRSSAGWIQPVTPDILPL